MKIPAAHSNAHDALQIANHGITFDVEGGQAWFSADRFSRESEHITLQTICGRTWSTHPTAGGVDCGPFVGV